jgi:TolB protein
LQAADPEFEFAYTSRKSKDHVGVYLHSKDGESLLTKDVSSAEVGSWSPDGRRIAFRAKVDERYDIYVTNLDTGKTRPLTKGPGIKWHPIWSPDGSTIAFTYQHEEILRVALVDFDGSDFRMFPSEIRQSSDFCWSSDGVQVAFCALADKSDPPVPTFHRRREDPYECAVWIATKDGKNPRRLTQNGCHAMGPLWSPDNSQIAFAKATRLNDLSDIQIYRINVDGTGLMQLTNQPGVNLAPKWSLDGKHVIFHYIQSPSDNMPISRIMYVSSDGQNPKVIDVGESGGWFPDIRKQTVKR